MESPVVGGIACKRDKARLTICVVPDEPSMAARVLSPIGDAGIDIDMIVQNTLGDGKADFTFTVHRDEYRRATELLNVVAKEVGANGVQGNEHIAKVSIVGVGM